MPGAGSHALLPACTSCIQGYAGVAGPLPHGPQEHALEAGLSSDVTWPTTGSVKLGNASLCVCALVSWSVKQRLHGVYFIS